MKVKKKIIKIVLIQLLFLITSNVICLFYKNELYFRQLSFVATISLIGIGLFIILSIYVNFNIFSIGGLFIFLSYIFHFGQVYTNVFSPGYKTTSTNFLLINQDINIKALLFAFNIIIIVSTFILLSYL